MAGHDTRISVLETIMPRVERKLDEVAASVEGYVEQSRQEHRTAADARDKISKKIDSLEAAITKRETQIETAGFLIGSAKPFIFSVIGSGGLLGFAKYVGILK